MGLDIRHQVLRVALSVKVNGKRRRLSLHRARPPRTCVKLSMKITVTTSRVGAYPHTQKSGLRRLTGAYPHTKISVAQSYPDPYVFGIQHPAPCSTQRGAQLTFTFTFICHPGKTHNHRSRGDTPWKAQTAQKHTRRQTQGGGGARRCEEEGTAASRARPLTTPARANV